MKKIYLVILLSTLIGCNNSNSHKEKVLTEKTNWEPINLGMEQASHLAKLPLLCINTEYPNKLGQVIGSTEDLQSPRNLHPAFYGCFDWHSAVHGHWSLVRLLKLYPKLPEAEQIKAKLLANISEDNIRQEVIYFDSKLNKSFERTYGWAWLLKLAEELHTWDTSLARELEQNLQPLTNLIIEKYLEFLPKLLYPIRVGEHTNTAFGLNFAYDYALVTNHIVLKKQIEERAKVFYGNDKACPLSWEPSGFDFLSPCLEEAALMKRILPADEYYNWISIFMPQILDKSFVLEPGKVSDRSDGKLVHLDGVNFSRAWNFYKIADNMPKFKHLIPLANKHINYSLPNLVDDSYEGGHWLASFAIYALNTSI